TLDGMRVVVDCANGAAYKSTPCTLRELGAEIFVYGNQPDGTNINKECGSMYPEFLCKKVLEHKADIGIAHDGDADRVLLCDEHGNLVDGDDIMAIAALDMMAKGVLRENTLIATVMSNAGLDMAIKQAGGNVVRTQVGDKHVIDTMRTNNFNLGGEQSGHIIFRDHVTTGDGLVAALQILTIMKTAQKPLSELAKCWTRFPQVVINIRVVEKRPFEELEGVMELVQKAERELKPRGGRILLRYSGTEPKARLLLEGDNIDVLNKWSEQISLAIKKEIGA
ncbi:MAG: phosphoglucosamine mutase, partial [Verrucomicrobiae bacterium]|nr:phosphoglucosamine mutase [Verrucomicrobiae bacterium]